MKTAIKIALVAVGFSSGVYGLRYWASHQEPTPEQVLWRKAAKSEGCDDLRVYLTRHHGGWYSHVAERMFRERGCECAEGKVP